MSPHPIIPFDPNCGPPAGQINWLPGDVVKVYYSGDIRLIGMVFVVNEFSTHDCLENHPRIKNPYPEDGGPVYLRFDPYDLKRANVLERLAVLGKSKQESSSE